MIKYGQHYDGEWNELCPICSKEYVHVGKVTFPKQETPPKDEMDDQRNITDVRIHFWGECGHEWTREWHTYKGITIVRIFEKKEVQIL